jgi:hypothetical protein
MNTTFTKQIKMSVPVNSSLTCWQRSSRHLDVVGTKI